MYNYCTTEVLAAHIATVFTLILTRLQESVKATKTPKFCKHLILNFCTFSLSYGGQALYDMLEGVQNGLTPMIVQNIWWANRNQCADSDPQDLQHMIIGATRLLFDSAIPVTSPDSFVSLFGSILSMIFIKDANDSTTDQYRSIILNEDDEDGKDFDNAYSKLAYANINLPNPAAKYPPGAEYFVKTLGQFCAAHPGQYTPLIQRAVLPEDIDHFQALLLKNGVGIV